MKTIKIDITTRVTNNGFIEPGPRQGVTRKHANIFQTYFVMLKEKHLFLKQYDIQIYIIRKYILFILIEITNLCDIFSNEIVHNLEMFAIVFNNTNENVHNLEMFAKCSIVRTKMFII